MIKSKIQGLQRKRCSQVSIKEHSCNYRESSHLHITMVEKCPTCGKELSIKNLGESFKHISECGMSTGKAIQEASSSN